MKFYLINMKYITVILFSIIIIFSYNDSKAEIKKLDTYQNLPKISFNLSEHKLIDLHSHILESQLELLIINFWATWCVPCISELPSLNELSKSDFTKNFEIWAISLDRGETEKFSKFLKNNGGENLKFAHDKKWISGRELDIKGIPETLIIKKINKSIKIISRHSGALKWDDIEIKNSLKKLVSE